MGKIINLWGKSYWLRYKSEADSAVRAPERPQPQGSLVFLERGVAEPLTRRTEGASSQGPGDGPPCQPHESLASPWGWHLRMRPFSAGLWLAV